MKAKTLNDLLKKDDRVAVSNITGREASKVSMESQKYCANIVGGWALGKGGQIIETAAGDIPVYSNFEELLRLTPKDKYPNKVIIYSPPSAVYGEVKEVVQHGEKIIETIYVITEHVSVEVTAKIYQVCKEKNIDIIGCNTLGVINVHDKTRIGAVGGDSPEETFKPGSITVISNSGNMVNTISSYLLASGMGTSFGISTGKDILILAPIKEMIKLALEDDNTKIIVLYVEPGGVYEEEAMAMLKKCKAVKPLIVYVAGSIAEKYNVSLGHAGAVVEGKMTSASGKMKIFDEYFGCDPFDPDKKYKSSEPFIKSIKKGMRVKALHDIPRAVRLLTDMLEIKRDFSSAKYLKLNPWFINLGKIGKIIPAQLSLANGYIPEPYTTQLKKLEEATFSAETTKVNMKNASHASSNNGITPRIFGYSLMDLMRNRSLVASLILYWTGELPENQFEEQLAEMTFMAGLTNGPGTISAQGAKLSASAGNNPNTAMIGTLASIGNIHGGNGKKAARFLLSIFEEHKLKDPYDSDIDVQSIAVKVASDFKKKKLAAKEASVEYERIPCLGHPVFKNDPVNYDPREQVIYQFIKDQGKRNVFLDFYHHLVQALKDNGSMSKVLAVNVDAAIACVWLGICWRHLANKQMTTQRVLDIPFIAFAYGRVAGGAGEYLDHQDFGTQMDMRVPIKECKELTTPRKLP
ncbi:MAG: hypothetical protein MJB14_15655 [Spirochaetes bacterium]|nr:hypothetical protein [Spirochaetota bacterium]